MTERPSYAPCEVELEFGDGWHTFRLPLARLAELQEKCKAGIGTIYVRVLSGEFYAEDLYETVRLGLIGGGMAGPEARRMIERYCNDWPLDRWHKLAVSVLAASMHGYRAPTEEEGPGEPEAAPETGSTSAPPSASVPTSGSDPETPET